jgi:hypothetical protein
LNSNKKKKDAKFKNSSYLVSHQNNERKFGGGIGLYILQKCALLLSIGKGVHALPALNTTSLKTVPPVVFGIDNLPSPKSLVAETLATNMSPDR